jgi:hypothetical protein
MRLSFCLLALLGSSAPALAQVDGPPPAPAPEPAPAPSDAILDTNNARREALFDLAFQALVEGSLGLAERAFIDAAALPGDPAQSAVAQSFAERVQHLRARRAQEGYRRADLKLHADPNPSTDVEVEQRVKEPEPVPRRATGRTEHIALVGTTTALGLGLYGWAVPGVLGVEASESARAFVGLYMLTAAGSFILPHLLLRDQPITPGQANMAFYGGTRGIWLGVLLGAVAAGDIGPDQRYRGWTAGLLLGSIGGLVGGYQLAGAAALTAGEARTMAAVGDLGLALGFGTGFLLHLDGQPTDCTQLSENPACFGTDPQVDAHARKMALMGLIGSGLGLTSGYFLARNRENTWGDGEVLRASALLGTWLAFGVADVAHAHIALTNRPFTGALMAGGLAGMVLGDRLVRNTDFTVGQSMMIDLSMVSGGLLATGTTYLLAGNDSNKPYILASSIGAISGFALAYWGFYDAAEGPTSRRLSRLSVRGVSVIPTAGTQGQRGLAVAGLF